MISVNHWRCGAHNKILGYLQSGARESCPECLRAEREKVTARAAANHTPRALTVEAVRLLNRVPAAEQAVPYEPPPGAGRSYPRMTCDVTGATWNTGDQCGLPGGGQGVIADLFVSALTGKQAASVLFTFGERHVVQLRYLVPAERRDKPEQKLRFAVGDRVRLVGCSGVVKALDPAREDPYLIQIDNSAWWVKEDELRKAGDAFEGARSAMAARARTLPAGPRIYRKGDPITDVIPGMILEDLGGFKFDVLAMPDTGLATMRGYGFGAKKHDVAVAKIRGTGTYAEDFVTPEATTLLAGASERTYRKGETVTDLLSGMVITYGTMMYEVVEGATRGAAGSAIVLLGDGSREPFEANLGVVRQLARYAEDFTSPVGSDGA